MRIKAPFEDGGKIPEKYTCDGADISPELKAKDLNNDTKYLAIVVDDPDAPGGTFDHWLIWNIPSDLDEIPGNILNEEKVRILDGASQGRNDFGSIGYKGPCPPGETHTYRFKFYELREPLDLDPGASKEDLERHMEGKVVNKAIIKADYSR